MSDNSWQTLTIRLKKLPQELQDLIFDFTVAIKPEARIKIQPTYQPPWQLQINHATRTQLAPLYFSQTKFIVATNCAISSPDLESWLRSLPPDHRYMIVAILCLDCKNCMGYGTRYSRMVMLRRQADTLEYRTSRLMFMGIEVREGVLRGMEGRGAGNMREVIKKLVQGRRGLTEEDHAEFEELHAALERYLGR